MGILNLNDDSFSGDGTLDLDLALARTRKMISEGADIIDVGGESARTNRAPISVEEEVARVGPWMLRFNEAVNAATPKDAQQLYPPLLSLNTWRPAVAGALLALGGDILNDMGALPNLQNAEIARETGAALVIMHSVGEPKVAHTHIRYENIIAAQLEFFRKKTAQVLAIGLGKSQIILDPGIDFAKQTDDSLQIYRSFAELAGLGFSTLLPVSRKTVIGEVLGVGNPADRDAGTVACIVAGAARGATIFRVHRVPAAWQTLKTLEALSVSEAAAALPDR